MTEKVISTKYDAAAAEKAVSFFHDCLRHTKGKWRGEPFTLSDWQADVVRKIYGTKKADGTRQYRTVFIAVPRKQGKTTFAAGLALYSLFCDGEKGAEVINAAADREQAALCFETAKQMVEFEPLLFNRSETYKRSIIRPEKGASYKVISSDAGTKHGLNVSYAGIDELHAWKNRELYDVIVTSQGAREQPLNVITTTAGYDKKTVCYELWRYAEQVRDGVIDDPTFLPVIFAADEDDDWTDPKTWAKANPNYGVTVQKEFFEQECAKAKAMPAYQNVFRRLYLNQWTEAENAWLSTEAWKACGGALPDLTGKPCFGGLDLSTTTDISAFTLNFPLDDGSVAILPYFFIPKDAINRRIKRDRVPYDVWVRNGYIDVHEGKAIDYDKIRAKINELGKIYNIKEIAIDRWNGHQISKQLEDDGFTMVGFGQGFASMSEPTKKFETLVLTEKLRHGDNPVLKWMAANVMAEQDAAGNLKPSKKKSTEKIDGIVASIMGVGRIIAQDLNEPNLEVILA